jgi:hypothetical protein
MYSDLDLTADAVDSNGPNGFWLGASYLFWPNSRVPNTTNRRKITQLRTENQQLRHDLATAHGQLRAQRPATKEPAGDRTRTRHPIPRH